MALSGKLGVATFGQVIRLTIALCVFIKLSDGELPLVGDLRWSDAALGWIANWRLAVNGGGHRWSVSGVNYDEAFRNAVRGAARVLSSNGGPL